jgi:hypothetical protein
LLQNLIGDVSVRVLFLGWFPPRLDELDEGDFTKLVLVNIEGVIVRRYLSGGVEVVDCLLSVSEHFVADSPAEVSIAVQGLVSEDAIEVRDGFSVLIGHLEDLGTLVPVDGHVRTVLDAVGKSLDSERIVLKNGVTQTNMLGYVYGIAWAWLES